MKIPCEYCLILPICLQKNIYIRNGMKRIHSHRFTGCPTFREEYEKAVKNDSVTKMIDKLRKVFKL